jgi:hypothetical protein
MIIKLIRKKTLNLRKAKARKKQISIKNASWRDQGSKNKSISQLDYKLIHLLTQNTIKKLNQSDHLQIEILLARALIEK